MQPTPTYSVSTTTTTTMFYTANEGEQTAGHQSAGVQQIHLQMHTMNQRQQIAGCCTMDPGLRTCPPIPILRMCPPMPPTPPTGLMMQPVSSSWWPLPTGEPECYDFRGEWAGYYCKLCSAYATEGHVASDKHKYRIQHLAEYRPDIAAEITMRMHSIPTIVEPAAVPQAQRMPPPPPPPPPGLSTRPILYYTILYYTILYYTGGVCSGSIV